MIQLSELHLEVEMRAHVSPHHQFTRDAFPELAWYLSVIPGVVIATSGLLLFTLLASFGLRKLRTAATQ